MSLIAPALVAALASPAGALAASALGITAGLAAFSGLLGWLANRAVPPRGTFVAVGAERVHCLEAGSGPPLLLIHGLGGQMGNFTCALMPLLARHFRVIAFDRPGSGHSSRAPGADAGVVAQAEAVSQLITALGLQQPLVVGHSLGGAIALALALNHPEQVRGLALIAPLTQPETEAPAPFKLLAIRSAALRRLVAWTLATPLALLRGTAVVKAIFAPDTPPSDFAIRGGGLLTLRPGNFIHASEDMGGTEADLPRMVPRYRSLQVPVSILFGRGDQILDPQRHGGLFGQQDRQAVVELVDGGHMLLVSAAAVTADFIRRAALREPGPPPAPTAAAAPAVEH